MDLEDFVTDPVRTRYYALLAVLTLCFVLVTPFFESPTYTFTPGYTDHMRHTYAAWTLLFEPLAVFTEPARAWPAAPYTHATWPTLAHMYPIGSLLVFVPFALLANLEIVSHPIVHVLPVVFFTASAGVATAALYHAIPGQYLVRVLATGAGGLLSFRYAMNGFFDPIVVALAAAGIAGYHRENYRLAMVGLVAALSMHYRAWYLGPLALYVTFRYFERREYAVDGWLLGSVALGAAAVGTGILTLVVNSFSLSATEGGFVPNPVSLTRPGVPPRMWVVAAVAVASVFVVHERWTDLERWIESSTVILAVVLIFYIPQWMPWYPLVLLLMVAVPENSKLRLVLVGVLYEVFVYLGDTPSVLEFLFDLRSVLLG